MPSALHHRLLARIREAGPLGFPAFMATALYDPEHGYYAKPDRRIGRHGDFFTSVSVGPAFGQILARWALDRWRALGRPDRWRIAEPGAHDGTLAADIVAALAALEPAATAGLLYTVPEPLPARRTLLDSRLTALPGGCLSEVIDPSFPAPPPLPGVVIANEVLDALPCHLLEFDGDNWLERAVDGDGDQLVLTSRTIEDPALTSAAAALGTGFPPGYRTEFRLRIGNFLAPLRDLLECGSLLFLDYGFARPEFYHPSRSTGTLRCYQHHRHDDDPLDAPGTRDISAHVDFTAVAAAGRSLGLDPARFTTQGSFLTDIGRAWIEQLAHLPDRERATAVRQFQTLTHPDHLGTRFHALELAWQIPTEPRLAAQARQRLVLD